MPKEESTIILPPAPADQQGLTVAAWSQAVNIDTYEPAQASQYPAYLDRRVYQGSSGRVYPMPFIEKISNEKHPHSWQAIHLENAYVRLMILPELGGRIHHATDKTTGYDFFYKNNVMKPALVGVLGPWISGGVEFNWPQHHRPATYLPTDSWIERHDDGSVTVWCSDHDPFARMKGMHGITLRPDSAVIELTARLYNRSQDVQTFLWWSNVAAEVHDDYQAFFPTDMRVVADHAKRAITTFPQSTVPYYGIDYAARIDQDHPDADRLDWYRNIPVPTSYMCLGTQDNFFGGYDHRQRAGFVYWSDRHSAPGKKMWTWGNAAFGQAWDRNLTDTQGPYIELMAGAFTDNQPDFSYLLPGETKTFSQYWYPIQEIGVVHQANLDAAVHLSIAKGAAHLGVAVTRPRKNISVTLFVDGEPFEVQKTPCSPGSPLVVDVSLPKGLTDPTRLRVLVEGDGERLLEWCPREDVASAELPPLATEPPAPNEIATVEELFLTGLHLEQYRHATRLPEPYWEEALRRSPSDTRSATALAATKFRRGQIDQAVTLLETAVGQLTFRNPNPSDCEAFYRLGLAYQMLGQTALALDCLYKAAWDQKWTAPALTATARIQLFAGENQLALQDADRAAQVSPQHLQAVALAAVAGRRLGRSPAPEALTDPLDWWNADLRGHELTQDPQTLVDVALEYVSCGEFADATRLLELAIDSELANHTNGTSSVSAVARYHLAHVAWLSGHGNVDAMLRLAANSDTRWNFPVRLADAKVLEWACSVDPNDATSRRLLGHWLYGQDRHADALKQWSRAIQIDDSDPITRRNAAVAQMNLHGNGSAAIDGYDRALELAPTDSRLWFERDQLAEIAGETAEQRLERLEPLGSLIEVRDDLTAEFARLLVLANRAEQAERLLEGRQFHPWEGGEGLVLGAWELTQLALARDRLRAADPLSAELHLRRALLPPNSLGEGPHPLANMAELHLTMGDILQAQGLTDQANAYWQLASTQQSDFLNMSSCDYSLKSVFSAIALRRLGAESQARSLLKAILRFGDEMSQTPGKIDYFATSLPSMLLFHLDLDGENRRQGSKLRAAALLGLGDRAGAFAEIAYLKSVRASDPEVVGLESLPF